VNRPPHVNLPSDLPGGTWPSPVPWCWCGRTWSDTPQGWAARERHREADLPACGEALRQRLRARQRQRRQAIVADPVLAKQLRVYEQEMGQRQRERRQHSSPSPR
jgi:hypothetical protein